MSLPPRLFPRKIIAGTSKAQIEEQVLRVIESAEGGSFTGLKALQELIVDYGNLSDSKALDHKSAGCRSNKVATSNPVDHVLRSNALRIYRTAQWHLLHCPEGPSVCTQIEQLSTPCATLSLASHVMETTGKWLGVKHLPEFQDELAFAAYSTLERLLAVYNMLLDDALFVFIGALLNELISTTSSTVHHMLVECGTAETWAKIELCKSATPVAFTIWARHYNDRASFVSSAADYLDFVSFHPHNREAFKSAYIQAFGNSTNCALSFVLAVRHIFETNLAPFKRMKALASIFTFLIGCTDVANMPDKELRDALRESDICVEAVSTLVKIKDDFQLCLRDVPGFVPFLHHDAFLSCIQFLRLNFDEYDGELWAVAPLRKGLLRSLFSLESVLKQAPLETFRALQLLLHQIIALCRKERFYKTLWAKLMHMWIRGTLKKDSSVQQLRQCFENDFNRAALIKHLRQTHRSPFRPLCMNPTCVSSDGSTAYPQKQCAKCKGVLYCSRTCQKAAWPLHKKFCGEIEQEGPLTRLSHNDKANCIASALFDYEHYLDAMPEDEKKKMPRSHAVRCDMTMTQSIRDFTCLVNKSGPQFFNIEVLKDKDPDGDKAWASAPALGRHLRECVAARLEAGFDDHTLVECIRHDGQFREEGAPAKFYAFVYMPWEVMLRAVHHRNLKVAVEHLGDEVRLHAGNPRFKIDWATGRILDDVLDRKSSVPNI